MSEELNKPSGIDSNGSLESHALKALKGLQTMFQDQIHETAFSTWNGFCELRIRLFDDSEIHLLIREKEYSLNFAENIVGLEAQSLRMLIAEALSPIPEEIVPPNAYGY